MDPTHKSPPSRTSGAPCLKAAGLLSSKACAAVKAEIYRVMSYNIVFLTAFSDLAIILDEYAADYSPRGVKQQPGPHL